MNRRRFLHMAVVGAGLVAGCVSNSPAGPASTADTPDTASSTTPDNVYKITNLSVTTSADQPSVNYILEPAAFYSADAVEREREGSNQEIVVMDISEIEDSEIQTAIKNAHSEGEWRSNTLPEGLAEVVERVDFFTGMSTGRTSTAAPHTHVGFELHRLHPDRPPAIEFNVSVSDQWVSLDSGGALELSLTNSGQETQQVFSGTVPPFGLVRAKHLPSDGEFLLWRNYEDEGCVSFFEDGMAVCDIGMITEVKAQETISRRYEVLPSETEIHPDHTVPPAPGKYRISDTLSYSNETNSPGSELSFEAEFRLESVAKDEVPENSTN